MTENVKKHDGRFWIKDSFVRKYARNLSGSAQRVFMGLCCHAGPDAITFIGCRRLGRRLGMNKNTVNKAMKELEAYGYLRRLDKELGKPSHIKIYTVPIKDNEPSQQVGHKEVIKEDNKEAIKNFKKNYPETYKKFEDKYLNNRK